MRVWDEETWESDYWDDFLKEFGNEAYVTVRYMLEKEGEEWKSLSTESSS